MQTPAQRQIGAAATAQFAGWMVSGPKMDAAAHPRGSTRVAVTFDDEDGGTRVSLRHDDLPTARLIEGHRVAGQAYLDRLRIRVAGAGPGPEPHG